MAPPRRGGRPFTAPELRGTLGTLLRTTLAQAGAVKDALERSAREGRARLDDVRQDRRRAEAVAELGELVLDLVRRGELSDLVDIPEIAEALAVIDEYDTRASSRERSRRDDEAGRDFIAPESRSRFDRGRSPLPDAEDGTVSSRAWSRVTPEPRAKPQARVWRPRPDEVETREEPPARARRGGGIDFSPTPDDAAPDDDDLSEYMHPDDVPEKK